MCVCVSVLAKDFMKDYIQVNIGSEELCANEKITQNIQLCEPREKKKLLVKPSDAMCIVETYPEHGMWLAILSCITHSTCDNSLSSDDQNCPKTDL